jgi:nucleoside 2-deoxyribosyltransferase
MLIYFAGPLFNDAELQFNAQLTAKLERLGFQVFLPQREGFELNKPDQSLSDDERAKRIFELDRDFVFKSDILLFILDGRVPDEGAALELGLAYAQTYLLGHQKRLIGYMTDRRAFSQYRKLNAMLEQALERVFTDEAELLNFLKKLLADS